MDRKLQFPIAFTILMGIVTWMQCKMSQPQTESNTAAKGGIAALTHALAVRFAGKVRVNSISPGWIDNAYQIYDGPDALQLLIWIGLQKAGSIIVGKRRKTAFTAFLHGKPTCILPRWETASMSWTVQATGTIERLVVSVIQGLQLCMLNPMGGGKRDGQSH